MRFRCAGGRLPEIGIELLGVSLAFGLTVLTMAFAIGHVSGCHLNPAVTLGLVSSGRFPAGEALPYIAARVLGAVCGAAILYGIASAKPGFELGDFAANGYGANSLGGYAMSSAFLAEALLTGLFLLVILGATSRRAPASLAPVAIGLCLTLIHLISIPVTNTSVNPARSTSQTLFVGGAAQGQIWLFWVAPIMGAVMGGILHRWLDRDAPEPADSAGRGGAAFELRRRPMALGGNAQIPAASSLPM